MLLYYSITIILWKVEVNNTDFISKEKKAKVNVHLNFLPYTSMYVPLFWAGMESPLTDLHTMLNFAQAFPCPGMPSSLFDFKIITQLLICSSTLNGFK